MPDKLISYLGVDVSEFEKSRIVSGIANPAVRKLSPGTKLFRVADVNSVSGTGNHQADGEAGNWWFGQKAFNKIMSYCVQTDQADRGLGYAAREALAILFGWSDCDLLIEAYLAKNATVFFGKGNPQGEGTQKFKGWADIEQWFIPQVTDYQQHASGKSTTKLSARGQEVIKVYRQVTLRSVKGNNTSYRETA